MKECLYCKEQFKNKTDKAKYCSASCRVMYHRKFGGKKDSAVPFDPKSMFDKLIDAINQTNHRNGLPPVMVAVIENPKSTLKIKRSYSNYLELKQSCPTLEEWNKLKAEIEESDLTSSEKKSLLN